MKSNVTNIRKNKDPKCDGCNRRMCWEDYVAHHCRAYKHSKHKNPYEHKMSTAKWKIPGIKGTVRASGICLTQGDIEMAKRRQQQDQTPIKMGAGQRIARAAHKNRHYIVGLMIAVAVAALILAAINE